MSQNDFVIANQAGAAFRADVNSALQALASLSSGTTAPGTTYAYQLWYDTTTSLLKIRNGANNAWVIIGPLADSSQHVIYVNNLAKVYVNSSGQMGIGVPSPSYALDVSGDVNVTGNFKVGGVNIPTSTSFINGGTAGGTASALTATPSPAVAAYAAGQLYLVLIATTSTSTTPTLNVSALGAKTIKKQIGLSKVALSPGDLQAATYALFAYDGTDMLLLNAPANAQGADVASAGTVNLDTATGDYVNVTGTTTITAVTLSQGREVTVKFAGILTLTNGANLILPTGANITTAAGDVVVFRGEASGVVRVVNYMRANGTPVGVSAAVTVAYSGTPSAGSEWVCPIQFQSGYNYRIEFEDIECSAAGGAPAVQMSDDNGSTYKTAGTAYSWKRGGGTTGWTGDSSAASSGIIISLYTPDTNVAMSFSLYLKNPAAGGKKPTLRGEFLAKTSGVIYASLGWGEYVTGDLACDKIKIINITFKNQGKVTIYQETA